MNKIINELIIDNYFSESEIKFLNEIKKIEKLSNEEEIMLIKKAQSGDLEARDRVVKSNLENVLNISLNFIDRGVDFLDLIQEGTIGLITAIDKYNLKRKSFQSYSYDYIYESLENVTCQSDLIRKPVNFVKFCERVEDVKEILRAELFREPSIEEISLWIGLSPEMINNILVDSRKIVSLDEPIEGEDIDTLMDCISGDDNYLEEIENRLLHKELVDVVEKASEDHPASKEGFNMYMYRCGFDGNGSRTFKEIGEEYNCSTSTAFKKVRKAERILRNPRYSTKISKYF